MKSMQSKYLMLIMTMLAMAFTSCGDLFTGGDEEDEMTGLAEALIDFPASMVSSEAGTTGVSIKTTTSADILTYLDYFYKPVRTTYNPIAQRAVSFVEAILESVETNIFAEPAIRRALTRSGSWSGKNGSNTEAYRATKNELDYTVEVWKIVDSSWLKTLHLDFTKAGSVYSGTAIAVDDTAGLTERPTYEVKFDTNDASYGQITEVRAVNIRLYDGVNPNVARKLWLKAWQVNDDFFVAANVHYTHVNLETQSPFYTEFMAEIGQQAGTDNVKVSYVYRGAVDIATNHGGISLALVPQTLATVDNVFTDYSIGELYTRAISDWIRTDPDTADTPPQKLITVLNSILTAAGVPAAEFISTSSTDAEIFSALSKIQFYLQETGQSSDDLNAVLFVVKAVNPGYFDAVTGFVGTEALNKPSWAGDVPAYSQSIDVTAAAIAADAYTITMPSPSEPDF